MYGRRWRGSAAGRDGRENAGMSNEKTGEIPVRRKPKVSRVKVIQGKGNLPRGQPAPKARTKVVADGKRVNIPVPPADAMEGSIGRIAAGRR